MGKEVTKSVRGGGFQNVQYIPTKLNNDFNVKLPMAQFGNLESKIRIKGLSVLNWNTLLTFDEMKDVSTDPANWHRDNEDFPDRRTH